MCWHRNESSDSYSDGIKMRRRVKIEMRNAMKGREAGSEGPTSKFQCESELQRSSSSAFH